MPIVSTTAYASASEAMSLVRSLLADIDTPTRVTITPTGVVRLANISTITTRTAHSLQIGDVVAIAATTDSTFNGTFTVDTVPTSVTFTVANVGADASAGNGYVDHLVQGDVYVDSILLPMLNSAYRKVQRRLNENGSKTVTKETDFNGVAADTTELTDTSSPAQLPPDFLAPRQMFERQSGGAENTWSEMRQIVDLTGLTSDGTFNRVYSWREDNLYLPGATQILDLRLRYFAGFDDLSSGESQILIRGGLDAVAYHTAFLAANSRDATKAATFLGLYAEAEKELLNLQAHARQYTPARRKPYNRNSRSWNYSRW